jgi:two-component system cell cycle response regulator
MDERRSELRLRRLKSGRIEYNGQNSVMSCTLRDVSEHGARLRFGEPQWTPDEFVVSIPGEIEARPAKRVWVSNKEIGIRFIG